MSKLYVNSIYSKTGASEAINIDSDGHVLTPKRIHVRAIGDGTLGYHNNAADEGFPMSVIAEDGDGNGASYYNTSTGVFTAPVSGVYAVSAATLIQNSTGTHIRLKKNGVRWQLFYEVSSRGWHVALTMLLEAGDTLQFTQANDADDIYTGDGQNTYSHVTFTHLG